MKNIILLIFIVQSCNSKKQTTWHERANLKNSSIPYVWKMFWQ